ncbi:hypothetical protein [Streptomyces sp. CMB-StM0423]|uniref:hypothetical protein n=1 Tax=Streptomyces sp. CMB-StM0423 TaxID=2059884 RepID=UPI000C6FECD8|nr:hypothetical protein [Streptomyces sp. CMB-StM0423]AUH44848.1 hypothetical protein CXR04_11820 [Streptomyces sp. CMB-StM0423]
MSVIEDLWREFRLPIRNALHFRDGRSYDVVIDPDSPSGLRVRDSFDLADYVASRPDWTSEVDGLASVEREDGDLLWAGDGSYGSEGFVARLQSDRTVVWAIFFTDSNPFTEIRTSGPHATFLSTSGVKITLDVDDPRV